MSMGLGSYELFQVGAFVMSLGIACFVWALRRWWALVPYIIVVATVSRFRAVMRSEHSADSAEAAAEADAAEDRAWVKYVVPAADFLSLSCPPTLEDV